jgi:hypothetical protein
MERAVEQQLSYYSKQQAIVIRLEAVLFRDGAAAGFDANNWITRWKAYINSEREVYEQASKTAPGELRPAMRKLVDAVSEVTKRMFRNEVNDDRTRFTLAANHSGDYSVCLALLKGLFAAQVIRMIDDGSQGSAITLVSNALATKNYPKI